MALDSAAVVPFEETFLIIGGWKGGNDFSDKVYKYTTAAADGDWQEMPSMKLSEAKSQLMAMTVPSSLLG